MTIFEGNLCGWNFVLTIKPVKHDHFLVRIGPVTEQSGPVTIKPSPTTFRKFQVLLMAQITDSQDVVLGPLAFKDKKGNVVPTPTGIVVAWSVDNPNLLALTPTADGLSCSCSAVGPLGTAMVSVAVADASGNPEAGGSVEIDIISGAPKTVEIPVGTPTEQP